MAGTEALSELLLVLRSPQTDAPERQWELLDQIGLLEVIHDAVAATCRKYRAASRFLREGRPDPDTFAADVYAEVLLWLILGGALERCLDGHLRGGGTSNFPGHVFATARGKAREVILPRRGDGARTIPMDPTELPEPGDARGDPEDAVLAREAYAHRAGRGFLRAADRLVADATWSPDTRQQWEWLRAGQRLRIPLAELAKESGVSKGTLSMRYQRWQRRVVCRLAADLGPADLLTAACEVFGTLDDEALRALCGLRVAREARGVDENAAVLLAYWCGAVEEAPGDALCWMAGTGRRFGSPKARLDWADVRRLLGVGHTRALGKAAEAAYERLHHYWEEVNP